MVIVGVTNLQQKSFYSYLFFKKMMRPCGGGGFFLGLLLINRKFAINFFWIRQNA